MMAMESYKREQQALQQQQQQLLQTVSLPLALPSNVVTTNASTAALPPTSALGTDDAVANTSQAGDDNGPPSILPVQMMIKPGVSSNT